jgi:hypothetical protein
MTTTFVQGIFRSKTGKWVVGDAWHMRGGLTGKIEVHYSFAHKIGLGLAAPPLGRPCGPRAGSLSLA